MRKFALIDVGYLIKKHCQVFQEKQLPMFQEKHLTIPSQLENRECFFNTFDPPKFDFEDWLVVMI